MSKLHKTEGELKRYVLTKIIIKKCWFKSLGFDRKSFHSKSVNFVNIYMPFLEMRISSVC